MTEGYNVRLKIGTKFLIGVTQDDMSVTPESKTSITKEDQGIKQESVQSHTTEFSVSGLLDVTSSENTLLNNDDIIELAYKKGAQAVLQIEYVRGSGAKYTGTGTITGYSESTPADPDSDSTYSLNIRSYDMAKATL